MTPSALLLMVLATTTPTPVSSVADAVPPTTATPPPETVTLLDHFIVAGLAAEGSALGSLVGIAGFAYARANVLAPTQAGANEAISYVVLGTPLLLVPAATVMLALVARSGPEAWLPATAVGLTAGVANLVTIWGLGSMVLACGVGSSCSSVEGNAYLVGAVLAPPLLTAAIAGLASPFFAPTEEGSS